MRALAQGKAVEPEQAEEIARQVGMQAHEAHAVLRPITQHDARGNIVGVLGLTLLESPHAFRVNGARLWTWCAGDTLFLPAVLGKTATIESRPPLSGEPVRLRVSPERIEDVSHPGAVLSLIIREPGDTDLSSVEAIWGTYCHHIHFFTSREEAERWRADREEIEILPLDEAYQLLGKLTSERLLAYE